MTTATVPAPRGVSWSIPRFHHVRQAVQNDYSTARLTIVCATVVVVAVIVSLTLVGIFGGPVAAIAAAFSVALPAVAGIITGWAKRAVTPETADSGDAPKV